MSREAWRRRCWRLWQAKIAYLADDHRLPPRCARCVELEVKVLPWIEIDLAALEVEDATAEAAKLGVDWTERMEHAHEAAEAAHRLLDAPRPEASPEPREYCSRCDRLRQLFGDAGLSVDLDRDALAVVERNTNAAAASRNMLKAALAPWVAEASRRADLTPREYMAILVDREDPCRQLAADLQREAVSPAFEFEGAKKPAGSGQHFGGEAVHVADDGTETRCTLRGVVSAANTLRKKW